MVFVSVQNVYSTEQTRKRVLLRIWPVPAWIRFYTKEQQRELFRKYKCIAEIFFLICACVWKLGVSANDSNACIFTHIHTHTQASSGLWGCERSRMCVCVCVCVCVLCCTCLFTADTPHTQYIKYTRYLYIIQCTRTNTHAHTHAYALLPLILFIQCDFGFELF